MADHVLIGPGPQPSRLYGKIHTPGAAIVVDGIGVLVAWMGWIPAAPSQGSVRHKRSLPRETGTRGDQAARATDFPIVSFLFPTAAAPAARVGDAKARSLVAKRSLSPWILVGPSARAIAGTASYPSGILVVYPSQGPRSV